MTSFQMVGKLSEPNNLRYLEWKIPNFSYFLRYPYPHQFILSPTFIFENISWHIRLYPYDNLSIYLVNGTQHSLNVNFLFGLKTSEGAVRTASAGNATIKNECGFDYLFLSKGLIENEDLCPSDCLTILCILKPGKNVKQVFNYYTSPKASRISTSEIVGELIEPNDLRQLEWTIPNYSRVSRYSYAKKFLISPSFIFENTSWHISFRVDDYETVFLINETQRPCHVNYSFSVKNRNGTLCSYYARDAIITKKSSGNYLYLDFFEDEEKLLSGTLTIVCILKPGENGKEVSNYSACKAHNYDLKSEAESLKLMKLTETDVLSKNLQDLFINKDYCDTILRVKNKEFYSHRTILMARSSVFAAMFQHDTAEKRTGIVNIPDCDVNTFQEFLEYLYTGKFEGVSFDSAFQLYSTSDKYSIQELKIFCTKFMMQNLSAQNVCEVVILADKYDEAMLYSAAQKFFNENFKEILKTSEWESLLKMNYRLANKLLIAKSESKE